MAVVSYPVASTAISKVDYDDEQEVMIISFHRGGQSYILKGVPKSEFDAFMAAGSKGSYWNTSMKGRY